MLRTASKQSLSKRPPSRHSFSTRHPYLVSADCTIRVGHGVLHEDLRKWNTSRSLSTPAIRYYAKTSTTSTRSDEPSPPPLTPPPKKVKVELRPGPVKAGKGDISLKPRAPQPQAIATASRPSQKDKQLLAVIEPGASEENKGYFRGIFDQTKADVRDAQLKGVLAPPPPDAPKWRTLIHQGMELFKFYFRGLKLVYSHHRRVRDIRRRVRNGGEPMTRWESRFIRTHNQDLVKLVPFVLIIAIIEEILPLIVIYAPFLLPSTCILPAQRLRIDTKRIDKQARAREEGRPTFDALRNAGDSPYHLPIDRLNSSSSALTVSRLLGLPAFAPFPGWRKHMIVRRLKYLAEDDALLISEGNGERLTRPELVEALLERGIITDGLDDGQIAGRLAWWLDSVKRPEEEAVSRRLMLVAQAGAY